MGGRRPALAVTAGALLLAGCTSVTDDGAEAKGSPSASPSASPSESTGSEPYTLSDEQAPQTRAAADAFVRELEVRPDYFGIGYRKREPFESDPDTWAVLQNDCLWQREALPGTVLASLTRGFELPEKDGKGAVYVSLTVTVHEDTVAARRDMAGSLESALRCPEQRLNVTDVVSGLYSRVDSSADARNSISDDDLAETGEWTADGTGKAYPFDWYKYRLGAVTVAATARHGAGRSEEEDSGITSDLAGGLSLIAAEIAHEGETGGTDEPVGQSAESEAAER